MREQEAADTRPIALPTVIGGAVRPPRRETPAVAPDPAPEPEQRLIRLALLDDHEVLLDSMASWLRTNAPEFDVVLTATTWLQLVHSPAFPTDLVVLDLQLKEAVSIEARIRTCRAAGAKVVVLTGLDGDDVRGRALAAGAAAFVSKSQPLSEVLAVARRVTGATPGRAAPLEWRPLPPAAAAPERPRLSAGEEEALRLYVAGRSVDEVAQEMSVQFETAKTYLRRVREKYARVQRPASRKVDLMRRAAEDGYLR
jgi:DNA-binding NarL/FixJ family response regulator